MHVSDLQMIKDIPGFKVVLKAILKSQIQQMVEQLAEYTGEESILLTASVSDGSLSHLGSESGKVFLEDHDDIKSQFLGFCLKRYHRQKQSELDSQNDLPNPGSGLASPRKFGPISRQRGPRPHVITPPQTYPVALVKSDLKSVRGTSKSVRHDPYPVSLPRQPLPRPVLNEKIEQVANQSFNSFPIDNAALTENGLEDTFTRNMKEALKVKLEALDNGTESDSQSENFNGSYSPQGQYYVPNTVEHSESPKPAEIGLQRSGTISGDYQDFNPNERVLAPSNERDAELSNTSRTSSDTDTGFYTPAIDHREIKRETVSESEMELEITGVDPGRVPHSSENWMSNMQDMIGSITPASEVSSQGEKNQDSPHHRNSLSHHRSPGLPHHGSPNSVQPVMSSEREGKWSKYSSDNKKGGWQRLLPESATQVMKSWLFQNIMNPYPPDDVKQEMARQTNLSLVQINNWFTNARRRIIQPMLDANNTKEAVEKLARYTSHHRTWSFNSDPDAGDDQKPTKVQHARLPVSHPQPAPDSVHVQDDARSGYESMEPDDLSVKTKTS